MLFAQFHQKSVYGPEKIIEACGDRAVIILDGRYSTAANRALAREECIVRGYVGFSIWQGRTFSDASEIAPLELVDGHQR